MMDDCTSLMAPGAEELLRFALDEEPLEKGASKHLKQCPICQQRLAIYTRTPGQLLSKLYRSECLPVMQLNLYCARMLRSEEEIAVAYHIAECPLCAGEIITIRQFLADFEPFPLLEKE